MFQDEGHRRGGGEPGHTLPLGTPPRPSVPPLPPEGLSEKPSGSSVPTWVRWERVTGSWRHGRPWPFLSPNRHCPPGLGPRSRARLRWFWARGLCVCRGGPARVLLRTGAGVAPGRPGLPEASLPLALNSVLSCSLVQTCLSAGGPGRRADEGGSASPTWFQSPCGIFWGSVPHPTRTPLREGSWGGLGAGRTPVGCGDLGQLLS